MTAIEYLKLNNRLYNACLKAGFKDIEEMQEWKQTLSRIPGIGTQGFAELFYKLKIWERDHGTGTVEQSTPDAVQDYLKAHPHLHDKNAYAKPDDRAFSPVTLP